MRFLTLSLFLMVGPSLAAEDVTHACASVSEAASRLACYDKAFPPRAEVMAAATEKAQADFGFSPQRELLLNPGQSIEQANPERIESQVVKVDHGGQRRFHLQNGQVWMQTESGSGGQVRPGETVQLRKAVLSGYQLVMPNGVVVRVRRIR